MTKPYTKRTLIVIRTKTCMTRTDTKIIWIVIQKEICMTEPHKNMYSHSYKDVYDENP